MTPWDVLSYSRFYPMTPLGGVFVGVIGLFIVLGSMQPRQRMKLLWAGFALGLIGIALSGRLAVGLPPPGGFQIGALVAAIVLEIAAFVVLMPRLRPHGDRAVLVGTLAIVGVHFIVMTPAFGPFIAALGILCTLNAAIVWRLARYPDVAAWFVDGVLKLGIGAMMILTSPLLHSLIDRPLA